MFSIRSGAIALIVATVAAAAAAGAGTAPQPGSWSGTAADRSGQDVPDRPVRFRLARHGKIREIRNLRVTVTRTCALPGPTPESTVYDTDIAFARVRVRPDGRFRGSEYDHEIHGRFTSPRRARGSIWVEADSINCTEANVAFTAARG